MANIATITNNIISALSGTTSQVLLGDATLTDFKLDSLTDVNVPTPGDGDVLRWNAATSLWEASDAAGLTGSGTTNYLPKFTGASTLGNSSVQDDATKITLGISTYAVSDFRFGADYAGPNTSLIKWQGSGALIPNSLGIFTWGDAKDIQIGGANVYFRTEAGTQRMLLNSSGNLGLGVVPSAWATGNSIRALQMNGGSFFVYDTSSVWMAQNMYISAALGNTYVANGFATVYLQSAGSHYWNIAPTGTAGTFAPFTTAMILNSSGRLGIGTTTPQQKLSVVGSSIFGSDKALGTQYLTVSLAGGVSDTREIGYVYNAASNREVGSKISFIGAGNLSSYQGGYLTFSTSAAGALTLDERMRIDVNGSVGIGTTSPQSRAQVTFQSDFDGLRIQNSNRGHSYLFTTAGTSAEFFSIYDIDNSQYLYQAGNTGQVFLVGGSERMRITSAGDVGIGVTSPGAKLHVNGAVLTTSNYQLYSGQSIQSINNGTITIALGAAGWTVNGTLGVTGASTFNDTLTLSSTASSFIVLNNTTATTGKQWRVSSAPNGRFFLTNVTDAIDVLTVLNTGAATFSSSVTGASFVAANATANITLLNGTADQQQIRLRMSGTNGVLDVTRNSGAVPNLIFGTEGTERMRLDGNGYLGIGTSSPSYKLHVVTDAVAGRQNMANISRTTGNWIRFTNPQYSTDASVGLMLRVFPDSDTRQGAGIIASGGANNACTDLDLFATSSPDGLGGTSYSALRIAGNTGYVGIGTTAPNYTLDLQTASTFITHNLKVNSAAAAGNYAEIAFQLWSGATGGQNVFGGAGTSRPSVVLRALSEDASANGALVFGTFGAGATNATLTEKMRLTSTGNLGIGTTAPAQKLHVDGNSIISGKLSVGTTYNGFAANIQGTTYVISGHVWVNDGYGYANASSPNTGMFPDSTHNITFKNNNSTSLYINSSGRVGIGTTSPATKLHILGIGGSGPDGSNLTMIIEDNTGLANQNKWGIGTRIAPNMFAIQDLYANATRLVINESGNVGIGTTAPNTKLSITPTWTNGVNTALISSQIDVTTLTQIGTYVESTSTAATAMTFYTFVGNGSSTEKMRITSAGDVGIGVTAPNVKLDVNGTIDLRNAFQGYARLQPSAGNGSQARLAIRLKPVDTAEVTMMSLVQDGSVGIGGNITDIISMAGAHLRFTGAGAATFVGGVDLGTTNMLAKLNVSGHIFAVNGSGAGSGANVYLGSVDFNSAGYWNSAPGIGAVYSATSAVASDLAFYTYAGVPNSRTERARFFYTGNLGIGSTSDTGERLQVTGTMKVTGIATFSSTYGFAIGSIAGNRRIQYGSDSATAFSLLTDTNSYAGLYSGTILSSLTNGSVILRELGNNAANNAIEVHIRPSAGKSGYLTFTENAVADRWAVGIANANGNLRFIAGTALGTEVMTLSSAGALTTTGDATINGVRVGKGPNSLSGNTVLGASALNGVTTGTNNVAIGPNALDGTTTGIYNIAIGFFAGGIGANENTTGSSNIFIGAEAQGLSSTESNRTWIGSNTTVATWLGGNLLLGTRTNSTYRLDVVGSGRITNGLYVSGGIVAIQTLAGAGTAIVVTDNAGNLSTQPTSTYLTSLTGEATNSGSVVTLTNSAVIGKVLTGLNVSNATITASDSILSAFGKIQGQIDGLQGGTIYKGSWNANTNTPTITSSTGTQGNYYVVTTAGTTNINGVSSWAVGDWIIFNGTVWEKIPNVDSITSVNGQTGVVSLTTSNINEGTNLYYTDTRSRAAISLTTSGSSGSATYSSGVINIPTYTISGLGGVATGTTITINGVAQDLSTNRTYNVGTVTSIVAGSYLTGGTITGSGTIAVDATTTNTADKIVARDASGNFSAGTITATLTGTASNATTADGLSVHANRNNEVNKIVRTDANGYIQAGWINTTSGDNGTTAIDRIYASSDAYIRYYTPANFRTVLDVPTRTGGSASGTWAISVTGNAATANTWQTARTITIGSTGKSLNGSADVSWTLGEIGAQAALTNPVTGTGESGQVAFWNGSTTQTGTNNLFWNNTNSRLGVNTASPSYNLHVNGTGYFSDSVRLPNNKAIIFEQTGGSILGSISMTINNAVAISNNSLLGVLVFDNQVMLSGRVGIGHSGNVYGGASTALSMSNSLTIPSSSFADSFIMYSSDVTAGNAAAHFRTENGAVIKLYQETTSVGNSIMSLGGGNSVFDDTTFDGYTLKQVVKALRNQGILA